MPDGHGHDPDALATSTRNLLQQQLIAARTRLDRQVDQLMRMNRLSNRLLASVDAGSIAESFAEAIIDVLDVPVSAVWIACETCRASGRTFACHGEGIDAAAWEHALPALVRSIGTERVASLPADMLAQLPGPALDGAIATLVVGRDGAVVGAVLASSTKAMAGMRVPTGDEARGMLAILAEKLGAHLGNLADRGVIERQVIRLRESEERLERVLRGTNDGWWDWDIESGATFVSPRWRAMVTGEPGAGMALDGFWFDRIHPEDVVDFRTLLDRAFAGDAESVERELRLRCDDGTFLPVLVRGLISRDHAGRATRFSGTMLDLSERKRYESHIHQLAFFDPLTELPNRRLLDDRLHQALRQRGRMGQTTAVMMIDLDRFKRLNDTHGHAAGDQLLRAVARRLRELVRPYDTVARLGGDEFVVLLEHLSGRFEEARQAAEAVAAKIIEALGRPYDLDVGTVHHSVSVGIALTCDAGLGAVDLLRGADVALYAAKESGRNQSRLFRPEMQQRVDRRAALEARLRREFALGRLGLHYQPIVDAQGALVSAEALVRWHAEPGESIGPSEFIPVAEDSGFIHAIGTWGLGAACVQAMAWMPHAPAGFRVAVNLSGPEFMHPEFPDRVIEALASSGLPGSALRLEITEATVVTELGFAARRMHRLREHGVEFSLDDFGTGYSSLTYLRRLPVSEVKIDRSYVRRMMSDAHDEAIVRAILAMSAALGLRVVAEGVETRAQHERLLDAGCTAFQGWLFGRPGPAPAVPGGLLVDG
jgi:diguanylate cyclase (GGDEF)-like protein/PAS domain S-box-containing protein